MVVGVVFDVDGTLVTFQFDVRGTRSALIGEMARLGYDTGGLDLTSPIQTILDSARAQSGTKGLNYEELRQWAFSMLDRSEVKSDATTAPIPGVRDALDLLLSGGARLGVLTNSGRTSAALSLRKAGLTDCFEFVLTRDDTIIMKPRPEGLEEAAARFGIAKNSVYYVGDTPYDVRAARDAGVRVVSVATGNYTVERLRSEGPDFAIASLSELPRALGF
jgi:HAD superfamily hydrolase (TIGR01509 family)